jgi:uncharacterized repeat protein (TIGR03803 family)
MQEKDKKLRRPARSFSGIELLEQRTLFSGFALAKLGVFTDGGSPSVGLITDNAGNLYGVTESGGVNGTGSVYEVLANSRKIITLGSFPADTTGSVYPSSIVFDSSGDIIGTDNRGGINGTGEIFKIVKGSGAIASVVSFQADDENNTSLSSWKYRNGLRR